MGKYQRLGKNTVLVFIGNAGSRLIALFMLPFYTRWLTPAEYGTTDVINTYAMLIMGFIAWCISDAIFVVPKNGTEEEKKTYYTSGWTFSFIAFLVAAVIFYLLDGFFVKKLIHNSFSDNLWYIYFVIVGTFVQNYTQQFTRSIDKMAVYSITGVIHTLTLAILAFVFIPGHGVKGYIISYILSYIIAAIYSFIFSGSYKYVVISKNSTKSLKILLKYSVPLIPNSIMWWMVTGLNRPLIEANIGMEGNGILAVANRIPGIIGIMFAIFNNAWTISMLEEYGKKDFVNFFSTAVRCIMLPTILFAALLSIFMKPVITLFANVSFIEAYKYAPIAILSVILSNLSGLIGGIFAAKKQSKYFFYSSFWAALVSVISIFVLIPKFGLYGAMISSVLSFSAGVISRYIYAKKDLIGFQFRPIIISLVFFTVIVVLVPMNISLLIKIVVYIFSIMGIVLINKDIILTMLEKAPAIRGNLGEKHK